MKHLAFILMLFTAASIHAEEEKPKFYLNEIGVGSGYATGTLRYQHENYEVVPIFLHLGFAMNRSCGFPNHPGILSFVIEPFYNPIVQPKSSMEVGFDVFFQYAYPVVKQCYLYAEIGAGPMYLGLKTVAQGSPGFNFLDQVGAGAKVYLAENMSLNIGYRYRHISHAGIRGKPNKGIDTNAAIVSYSFYR